MSKRNSNNPSDIRCPGVYPMGSTTVFAFDTAGYKQVSFVVADALTHEVQQTFSLTSDPCLGSLGTITIETAMLKGMGYYYLCDGEKTWDPYAACVKDELCFLMPRGKTVTPLGRVPEDIPDMLIYKLHVRGFTKNARMKADLQGTFKGLEKRLDYLVSLGINTVEMMPVYTFDPTLIDPKTGQVRYGIKNYWGYSAKNAFLSPNCRYCASSDPVSEFKHLVKAMHDRNLACYLEFFLPYGTDPTLVRTVLHHWRIYYGVDGFRVFGGGEQAYLLLQDPLLKNVHLIFEGLDEGCLKLAEQRLMPVSVEDRAFTYVMRETLKGDEDKIGVFTYRMLRSGRICRPVNTVASTNGFTLYDLVSYNNKHNEANMEYNRDGDGYNASWNCGEEGTTKGRKIRLLRMKQMKNALAYLFLSQGIPMLNQGDERLNTQQGNNNAYASDNDLGWIDWSENRYTREMTNFAKGMIALRQHFPMLHQIEPLREVDYMAYGTPDVSFHERKAWYHTFSRQSHAIGMLYNLRFAGDKGYLYLAVNNGQACSLALPELKDASEWSLLMCTAHPGRSVYLEDPRPLGPIACYEAPERSVSVLMSDSLPVNTIKKSEMRDTVDE
ncbi:MAG: hypothetical protein KBS83_03150 [Lachnospiraceae bacterium]|nr:hypothetical protein [Candidatus Equihabitans merdae]